MSLGSVLCRSRLANAFAIFVAAVTVVLALPQLASAETPLDLGGKRIVDTAGVLSADDLTKATDAAQKAGLYSVYVDSFDGQDPTQWCIRAAQRSQLDTRAILLVVATGERKFDLCAGSDVDLDASERDAIGEAARDQLADDNWAGATIAAAQAISGEASSTADDSSESDGVGLGFFFLLIVVSIVIIAVLLVVKRRKNKVTTPAAPQHEINIETATQEIVAIDDGIRLAREDLDYAAAELGDTQAAPFSQALRDAESARDQAWELLRKAQNESTPAAQKPLLIEALSYAHKVTDIIGAQTQAFAKARDVQARAGVDLAASARLITEARASIDSARVELQRLHHDFAHTSFSSLDDNPDQAARLLDSAEQTRSEGEAAWHSGERETAIAKLTLTQRALAQAQAQIGQVMQARETLGDVNRALLREIAALGSDLDDAQRLGDPQSHRLSPLVSEAREAIAVANKAREGAGDPLAAIERLTEANAALDEILDPLRDTEAATVKAAAAVSSRIDQVERQIQETETYISHHRGGVGAVARERANQAGKLVAHVRSIVNTDPQTAKQNLREAATLISQAQAIAEQDVASSRNSFNDLPGFGQGSTSGRGGVDVGSLILGGLLFGGSSSHSSGSSWGGVSSGGFGGGSFGSSGGFSGGFGGGSF